MQGFMAAVWERFSEPPGLQLVVRVIAERVSRVISKGGGVHTGGGADAGALLHLRTGWRQIIYFEIFLEIRPSPFKTGAFGMACAL
jgi:hypothetical protein